MKTYHIYRFLSEKHGRIIRLTAHSDEQAKKRFEEVEKLDNI